MASLINREMFWALPDPKVIPCVVVAHDLAAARVTVLLANGPLHDADAYDVRATESDAVARSHALRSARDLEHYMAINHPNI